MEKLIVDTDDTGGVSAPAEPTKYGAKFKDSLATSPTKNLHDLRRL